jgi:group I intron endonuclease
MEKIGYIYKITSPTGSIYIGKTISLKTRISNYKNCSGIERQRILYNSIKKYSWESHIFEIIEETKDIKILSDLEIFYIKKFNSYRHTNEKGQKLHALGYKCKYKNI